MMTAHNRIHSKLSKVRVRKKQNVSGTSNTKQHDICILENNIEIHVWKHCGRRNTPLKALLRSHPGKML